jgi:hypothetical protein
MTTGHACDDYDDRDGVDLQQQQQKMMTMLK